QKEIGGVAEISGCAVVVTNVVRAIQHLNPLLPSGLGHPMRRGPALFEDLACGPQRELLADAPAREQHIDKQLEPFGRRIALYTDVQLVCKRASARIEQTRDDFLFAVAHAVVRSNWDLPYHRCSNGYGGGAVPCRKSGRALVF